MSSAERSEPTSPHFEHHNAERYGQSFADVYDSWYPADEQSNAAVAFLLTRVAPGDRVLELGVGTGRLALPLAHAGVHVDGIDASIDMLDQLTTKTADLDVATRQLVHPIHGDVSDADVWPQERYGVVLGAFNLLFNLTAPNAIETVFRLAANHLTTTGHFVIETFEPVLPDTVASDVSVKSVTLDGVDLIATTTDPATQLVVGQHIQFRTQPGSMEASVQLRPWELRVATLAQLDSFAHDAGLELSQRFDSWTTALAHGKAMTERGVSRTDTHPANIDSTRPDFDGSGIVSVYSNSLIKNSSNGDRDRDSKSSATG